MDIKDYEPYWVRVEPLMRAKLEALKEALRGKTEYVLSDITVGGDEELRVSLDLRKGGITALGVDFSLLDADVNGAEAGVGIKLDLIGFGALVLGGYAPHNYTDQAFTTDMDEVESRVEMLDVDELADFIVKEALTNETLLHELADAGY